jgi:hypothetical protein
VKETLWDMLITMPPPYASAAKEHKWPAVECPKGVPVRATQRDLRRFRTLKAALSRMQSRNDTVVVESLAESQVATPSSQRTEFDHVLFHDTEDIVEPVSWTALAYSGFMWWASAGEQAREEQAEEVARDSELLEDFVTSPSMSAPKPAGLEPPVGTPTAGRLRRTSTAVERDGDGTPVELAVISYFHRLTTQIFNKSASILDSHSDCEDAESSFDNDEDALLEGEEDGEDGRGIRIGSEDIRQLGLDVWSEADKEFVRELFGVWFGRESRVEGRGVDVCGVRVC